jgi:hypothetical protein
MSVQCYNLTWMSDSYTLGAAYIGLAIPALIFHILFWIQVATHRTLRQMSMLWVYNYLFTDLLLLGQIIVEFVVRTTLPYCISQIVFSIFCTLEAYTNAYMSVLEAYMLVCLNVSRYYLIVKNHNISARYPWKLLLFNVSLYIIGLGLYIFQDKVLDIVIIHPHYDVTNCHFLFPDIKTQICNLTVVLIIPVALNCYFMSLTTIHVRRSQQAIRAQV